MIDLSDRARAILERNKSDQVVADRLQEQLAASRATKNSKASKDAIQNPNSLSQQSGNPLTLMQDGLKSFEFAKIEDQERRMINGEQLQLGQERMSPDEEFQDGAMRMLVRTVLHLEASGKTAEASDLRSAITTGAVKFERASDVTDLNLKYTYEKTATGERSGMDLRGATGEPAALLASNHATAFSTPTHGPFLISW